MNKKTDVHYNEVMYHLINARKCDCKTCNDNKNFYKSWLDTNKRWVLKPVNDNVSKFLRSFIMKEEIADLEVRCINEHNRVLKSLEKNQE